MTDRAAHLVDHVFPDVPIRQWVLTLPPRLRYLLAWDHTLCRAVVAVYLRAVLGWLRRQARRRGVRDGRGVADGDDGFDAPDRWAEDAPTLAGLAAASVSGVAALGARAGAPVRRWGDTIDVPDSQPIVRWHARHQGFDLHAGIVVPAGRRDRLARLCRYALRPPVGQDRRQLMPDGTAVLELRRRWTDGTTHLVFDPVELLERLAACPQSHLGRFDAAQFRLRRAGVPTLRGSVETGGVDSGWRGDPAHPAPPGPAVCRARDAAVARPAPAV